MKGESYGGQYTNGVPETQLDFMPARSTNSPPAAVAFQPVASKPVLPAGIPEQMEQVEEKPVYLAGFAMVGTKATVFLTDGRQYTTDDRELQFIGKQFVVIDGKKILLCASRC